MSLLQLNIQFDSIGSGFFLFINDLSVNLGGTDVCVAEHFAYGIDVGAICKLESSECVAEAVKGDVFRDTSGLNPAFQRL